MKHRDRFGRFVTDKLPYPFIDDFAKLDQRLQERLLHIAQPARAKKRLANNRMDDIILALCAEHFLPISVIAMLVNRTAQNVREKQLVPLVNQGKMQMAFPHTKRHKMQGYITLNKAN